MSSSNPVAKPALVQPSVLGTYMAAQRQNQPLQIPLNGPLSPDIEDRRNQSDLSKAVGSTINDMQDFGRRFQQTYPDLHTAWHHLTTGK